MIQFLLCLLLLLVGAQAAFAADAPAKKTFVYKKVADREMKLFVSYPEGWKADDRRPAVVFFHGGGWVGGAPTQFDEHSTYLASRGMVAIQVEYRLLDKSGKEPPTSCVQDARSAMRWVRSHAAELGIDPDRIASGGGSAGGHLAACVGMIDNPELDDPQDDKSVSCKSNAMLLFNPVFDNGPGGWGHQRVGDRYLIFSPFHNVSKDDPPAIVFLGSDDKLIPVKTVEDFKAAMEKVGVRCETHIYEGQGHGFFNVKKGAEGGGKYYYETMLAADKFLIALGWLKGEPTLKAPEEK